MKERPESDHQALLDFYHQMRPLAVASVAGGMLLVVLLRFMNLEGEQFVLAFLAILLGGGFGLAFVIGYLKAKTFGR